MDGGGEAPRVHPACLVGRVSALSSAASGSAVGPWWVWKEHKSLPGVFAVPANKQAKGETFLSLPVCDCRSELKKQTQEVSRYLFASDFFFFPSW